MLPGCKLVKRPGDVCPHLVKGVLDYVAGKWSVLIVGTLANYGSLRYTELADKLGPISPKTLAARLRGLHSAGLVARRAYPEIPPRVEYSLTDRGRGFWRAAVPLVTWAARHEHRGRS